MGADWTREPGLMQVTCGCLSDVFRIVISDVAVRAICAGCGSVNAELTRPPGWRPFMAPPPDDEAFGGNLPVLHGPPVVAAGWLAEAARDMLPPAGGMVPQPPAEPEPGSSPVLPPAASAGAANAVMEGGPWNALLLALPDGLAQLASAGLNGCYRPTDKRVAGLTVFGWVPVPQPGDGPASGG